MSAISVEKVSKIHNSGRPNEFRAIVDLSIDIPSGQTTILAGPSGSGKTTFLALLGLMSRPSSGRIAIQGKETTLLSESFRTVFRRHHIGFVFQHFNLVPDLTVKENLDLVLYPNGMTLKRIRSVREHVLERFGLLNKADYRAALLSGGEKQRLAIGRALMNDPEIVLIDEPTAHLDTALSKKVIDLFLSLKKEKRTLIIASHDPLVLESGIADRLVHLRDGRLVEEAA